MFACALPIETLHQHVLCFCFGTGSLWSGCYCLGLCVSLCKGQYAELSCGYCWVAARGSIPDSFQQTGTGLPVMTCDMLGEASMGHCMCLMGWGPVDLSHVALRGPCREMCFGIWDEGPPGGRQEGREEPRWAPCQRGQMQQLGSVRRGGLK